MEIVNISHNAGTLSHEFTAIANVNFAIFVHYKQTSIFIGKRMSNLNYYFVSVLSWPLIYNRRLAVCAYIRSFTSSYPAIAPYFNFLPGTAGDAEAYISFFIFFPELSYKGTHIGQRFIVFCFGDIRKTSTST
ncbi:hypothetical protein ES703_98058 [subsurface metagenome]